MAMTPNIASSRPGPRAALSGKVTVDAALKASHPEELAAVIREVENGKTNNAVKQSLGVSPSTTEAVRAAWSTWQNRRELVGV